MKKAAVLWICGVLLFMTACGDTAPATPPEEENNSIQEYYNVLLGATEAFKMLGSGTLQAQVDYSQKHIDVNGDGGSLYENAHTSTIQFIKAGNNYNYLKIVARDEQPMPSGYKQENGVLTTYSYVAYEDGTFQWLEGAAELEYYELPQEADVFAELADIALIDDILKEQQGTYTKYTVIFDEAFFDYAAQQSELNSYELREYEISYFVNESDKLERVLLTQSEFWIQSENYNVEQTTSSDVILSDKNQDVDLNYFKQSGTYVKPVFDEVTEIWKEDFINIPETYILDVRVPKLKDSLPNAEKINAQIALDCTVALNATVEDLVSEGEWGGYPWHTVDFAVYRLGDVYEICIFNTEASAWGSGIGMWMYKYYYDVKLEDVVSAEDILERMNYTQEDVLRVFYEEFLGEENTGDYTYEEISEWYYFDEDASIQFYVNLFG